MSEIIFPDPRTHEFAEWVLFGDFYYHAEDIIHFGGELSLANLRRAYVRGIFPWQIDGLPMPWFCPATRAILEFDELHIPASLRKERRKTKLSFTIDRAFRTVVENCAKVKRSHESGTWITRDFIESYCRFHEAGAAHSVEAWSAAGELVGGLYGVDAGGVFCGESMFHKVSNASKFALLHLVEHLQTRGAKWLDIQVMTPHFEILGAKNIPRREFLDKLEATQARYLTLF